MSATYIHRQSWKPKTCHQELEKVSDQVGLSAHPQAIVDKINRKLLERGIMPKILSAAIVAVGLCGCVTDDPPDPYSLKEGNAGMGILCTAWVHRQGSGVESDSTATCKDGSKPVLYYTQWFSDNSSCSVTKVEDVKGGMAGIRRVFGCAK